MPNVNVVELNIQQQPTMKRETSVSRFKVEKVERPADSVREPERNLAVNLCLKNKATRLFLVIPRAARSLGVIVGETIHPRIN